MSVVAGFLAPELALLFGEAHLSPARCLSMAQFFQIGFRDNGRYLHRFAVVIQGNICKVCRCYVALLSGHDVFRINPDADLHRCPADEVQGGFEGKYLANESRVVEVDPVDGGCYGIGMRVPGGNDTAAIVYHPHDNAAVDVAVIVGVLRRDEMRENEGGLFDGLTFHDISSEIADTMLSYGKLSMKSCQAKFRLELRGR